MQAHFIDVGQGDATLLEFSCGVVLIDTGGESTDEVNGSANLIAYLDKFFERRPDLENTLDLVAITHAHADHTLGISGLIERYTIRSVIDNGRRFGSGGPQQAALQDFASQNSDVAYQAILFDDIVFDTGLTSDVIDPVNCSGTNPAIHVLWGELGENPGWTQGQFGNGNNHSLVIRVDFGEVSFLFTGDLQRRAIDDLVFAYSDSETLDIDVYQVGRHVSHNATTEELMISMSPSIAIGSTGDSHRSRARFSAFSFGHPNITAIEHITDDESGVKLGRESKDVTVGIKGACGICNPPRPPVFETHTMSKALFTTGWDGTIVVSASSSGDILVETER